MTLQDDVSALKDGDYVRAVFRYSDYEMTIEGNIKVIGLGATFNDYHVRDFKGYIPDNLTSVTVIAPPIPPEPEVGSFALLKSRDVALHNDERSSASWGSVSGDCGDWESLYPQIRILYSPDGEVVWKK